MQFSLATLGLLLASTAVTSALNEARDIPGTTITVNGQTIVNSGIQGPGATGTQSSHSWDTTGSLAIIIGGSTYLQPGFNGGDSSSTTANNGGSASTAGTASASTTAPSSASATSGSGAQATQAAMPLMAGGMAALAYLAV